MGLPLLMGLAGLAAFRPSILRQVIEKRPVALGLLLLFMSWAVLSASWSDWHGTTAFKIAALFVVGLLFASAAGANAAAARLALAAAIAAFLVLALLLAVEATQNLALNRAIQPEQPDGELNRNPSRGLVVMLALVWPGVAWLAAIGGARSIGLAVAIVLIATPLSAQFDLLSTAFGFGAGLIAFAVAFAAPAFALRSLTLGLAGWMLAAPFLTPLLFASQQLVDAVPLSWAARIGIWRYVCERIMEQPWIGHGLDAGRAVSDRIEIRGLDMRGTPVHPHSASLQIWFETGLVGAVLAALVLGYGGWRLASAFKHDKFAAAAAAATLAMFGLMANVGWSLWQEWWMATLFLAAALTAAVAARGARG